MSRCKGCGKFFTPEKSYRAYCDPCAPKLRRCGKCKSVVFPKDKVYSCCGITESIKHVADVEMNQRILTNHIADTLERALGWPTENYKEE